MLAHTFCLLKLVCTSFPLRKVNLCLVALCSDYEHSSQGRLLSLKTNFSTIIQFEQCKLLKCFNLSILVCKMGVLRMVVVVANCGLNEIMHRQCLAPRKSLKALATVICSIRLLTQDILRSLTNHGAPFSFLFPVSWENNQDS